MIYGSNTPRLEYPTIKAIETDSFLIINGETYDKKTLAKLNNRPLELGMNNITTYNKILCLNQTFDSTISTWMHDSYRAKLACLAEDSIPRCRCSVVDSSNHNIEWTVYGETVIKMNIEKKTFELFRHGYGLISTLFLHQDDDYIYYLCKSGDEYAYTYINTIKKLNGEYKNIATAYSGSYVQYANLIHKDGSTVYIEFQDLGTKIVKAFTLSNGASEEKSITFTELNLGSYCSSYFSKREKTSKSAYAVNGTSELVYRTIDALTITGSDKESFLTGSKIKGMVEFFKNKYPTEVKKEEDPGSDMEDTEIIKKFMTFNLDSVGTNKGSSYRIIKSMLAGDTDQFLVISTGPGSGAVSLQEDYLKNCKIMVFKRNNPSEDPFDLTLVDYYRYIDMMPKFGLIGDTYQINPTKFVQNGTFGVRVINLSNEGKLSFKEYYNPDLQTFGFDAMGRLYILRLANTVMEMFSDALPYDIKLSYENKSDAFIPYSNAPVNKNILVDVVNVWNEPVVGNYELALTGDGQFSKTSSTNYRGATNKSGKDTVQLKINKPTTVTVSKKLLYNNELAFAE